MGHNDLPQYVHWVEVLEHSHRPVHLRKGDFYSYLSLSSHDSDCGEVSQCSEDKSPTSNPNIIPSYVTPVQELHSTGPRCKQETSISDSADYYKCNSPRLNLKNMCNLDLKSTCIHTTCAADGRLEEVTSPHMTLPSSPDIRDEEILFSVCTEEVYLGPPLCYSMVLTKKPQRVMMKPSVVSSFGGGHDVNKKVRHFPCSNDYLQWLSQVRTNSMPGDSQSDLSLSKQVVVDQSQDYLHFQGSVDTDESPRSLSPFLKPCYSSPSTSPLLSDSTTIQEPSSDPIDKHLSPPLVSSGMEEEKQGEDMYLCSHVAGGEAAAVRANMLQEEESHNEGPSYLNPRAHVTLIDSFTSEYLADTKILESNMGTVMTKISVCSSTTNPSKGPATTAMRINPQINSSLMKKADMKACERHRDVETQLVKQKEKKGWSTSQQEVKTAMVKQPMHHEPATMTINIIAKVSQDQASHNYTAYSQTEISQLPGKSKGEGISFSEVKRESGTPASADSSTDTTRQPSMAVDFKQKGDVTRQRYWDHDLEQRGYL
ncbi:unnamed protein product [Menidia menidia]|uniref:(Atlantic silverside) hypothetical protein n=1 Tax=Menidia menidia TaxID=238744 RepID=A0A8S4ARS6_9TELE|nr:unnamed protein product [Menidia menidia]